MTHNYGIYGIYKFKPNPLKSKTQQDTKQIEIMKLLAKFKNRTLKNTVENPNLKSVACLKIPGFDWQFLGRARV